MKLLLLAVAALPGVSALSQPGKGYLTQSSQTNAAAAVAAHRESLYSPAPFKTDGNADSFNAYADHTIIERTPGFPYEKDPTLAPKKKEKAVNPKYNMYSPSKFNSACDAPGPTKGNFKEQIPGFPYDKDTPVHETPTAENSGVHGAVQYDINSAARPAFDPTYLRF